LGFARSFSNLRGMFEGTPLPIAPLEVLSVTVWIALCGLAATVMLRSRFEREWALTLWSAAQIKRVWQRLADESARTGGTLTSHLIGVIAWAILGSLWGLKHSDVLDPMAHWIGAGWGALLGLATLILRHVGGAVGALVTLERESVERGFEVDRHMRNWWFWILCVFILFELTQHTGFAQRKVVWEHVISLWWIWLSLKWLRQLQSIAHKRLHFGWGIAYICTFEIGPALWLFSRWG
jgi:hypothetical protein